MSNFHTKLNRMAFFTALILCAILLFYRTFLAIAASNIYLNGVIIGTTLFGIILCFIKVFQLLPEYRWLKSYMRGHRAIKTPRLLRSISLMLTGRPQKMDAGALHGIMDMILVRFEDDRESLRYVTNTLIFLGLLGTFWGLILTVGGFAELISNLNFTDETVLESMQRGLNKPLGGMATAFTSSLLGLGGSLVVGFLALQVQLAQGAIFRDIEDFLAKRTSVSALHDQASVLPKIQENVQKISEVAQKLDDALTR